jgi:cytochrome P450
MLFDLFGAGSETTTTTLRWFFLYLIHHSDIQQRIHQEIDAVVGYDREPEWGDRNE